MNDEKPVVYSTLDEEYKSQFKAISKNYLDSEKRRELAIIRVKLFAATLYRLIHEEEIVYDLILAPGNSGVYMTEIAKWVYDSIQTKVPPIVTLPIYRFNEDKTLYDNRHLAESLKQNTSDLHDIRNVLFIDDEIMTGTSANNALSLLREAKPSLDWLNCTIVAEHHFFEWRHNIPKTSVNFYAYARLIWGLNNNIAYFISKDIYEKLAPFVKEKASYNHVLAVLVGGKLKQRDLNNKGFYNTDIESNIKKQLNEYDSIKTRITEELKLTALAGINDYKNKKFVFRF